MTTVEQLCLFRQEAPLDHAFSNGRELDDADFSDKMLGGSVE